MDNFTERFNYEDGILWIGPLRSAILEYHRPGVAIMNLIDHTAGWEQVGAHNQSEKAQMVCEIWVNEGQIATENFWSLPEGELA